ncbi:probable aspartyl aminopeptidase [Tanacetum coccineum]
MAQMEGSPMKVQMLSLTEASFSSFADACNSGSKPDDICDFELQACDTKPSIISGAMKEFIISERLDNLCMSLCSLKMLWCKKNDLKMRVVRIVALFDHEEAGSTSAQGSGSPVIFDALNRITTFFSSNP